MKRKYRPLKTYVTTIVIFLTSSISYAQIDSIWHDGNYRYYLHHIPPTYDGSTPVPLLLGFHGGGTNASFLATQSDLNTKSDAENFVMIYPEGFPNPLLPSIRTWNAGLCCGLATTNNSNDVGFIDALLDTLFIDYNIDQSKVYATGMSNGAYMTYRLACELSDRIAAIAPIAGALSYIPCNPARSIPIIHFHSANDSAVPIEGGTNNGPFTGFNYAIDSLMNLWSEYNDCELSDDTLYDGSDYLYRQWTNCACNATTDYYLTFDGGHSWPGGTQLGAPFDSSSTVIDANDLMWSFFQKHSIDCGPSTITDETNEDSVFQLFPNPSTGIINIRTHESVTGLTIIVCDNFGRIILKSENKHVINLTNHPAGIYYISILSNDQIIVRKVLKID